MPEIIQDWLGTRLGILLDLCPQKFGRNTKDGVLLAKLLYSYGVIPLHVLDKIKENKNYFVCYNNLKILKPWLEHIGVTQDDSSFQEIARGEGSYAISLFYAVYLNLERRDRLYYLSYQKERKFSESSCKGKFKVDWVPEISLVGDQNESLPELAHSFLERRDMIDWHRAKCKEVIEKIKKVKLRFSRRAQREEPKLKPVVSKHSSSKPLDSSLLEAQEAMHTINSFEQKHLQKSPDLPYSELLKLKDAAEAQPCFPLHSTEKAKNIICDIKHRKKNAVYARNFQRNMQHLVLDEQWKEITNKQNELLENKVCETLLKQSQYEKQMASKLYQVRHQKKVFAENRKLIENLKLERLNKEYDSVLKNNIEIKSANLEDEKLEKEKLMELHRTVYGKKLKIKRETLKIEGRKILLSIIDIAIRVSEIRELTGCQIPKALMKDLKELFCKNLPIFDLCNNLEELYVDNGKSEKSWKEENDGEIYADSDCCGITKIEEKYRQNVLNEIDFNDYIQLLGPWMVQLLFPDGTETEVPQLVLNYIVRRILKAKYPPPARPLPVPIKSMKPTAIIQDLEGDAYDMFVDLMESCKILVVHVDDAINFVLSMYKKELSKVREVDINFVKLSTKALKPNTEKEKVLKKKILLLKKEEPGGAAGGPEDLDMQNKETQTPRTIPEEDPSLSPNAEIGRLAFEALGCGDPVPDNIIICAIIAYVSFKQNDYDGWVLMNYPRIYTQASDLECALTGYRLLPLVKDQLTLEEFEGFLFRQPCVDPFSRDELAECRISRLISKPASEVQLPENPKSYFDIFIQLKKTNCTIQNSTEQLNTLLSLEEFYSSQGIFYLHEYSTLNFKTVKDIGKIILSKKTKNSESALDLNSKTSLEVFGNTIVRLNEKWKSEKNWKGFKSKVKTVDAMSKKSERKESPEILPFESQTEKIEGVIADASKTISKKTTDFQLASLKPGDPDWEWASGHQPEVLLHALASLWENMEAVFVEDLKDVFFCLRVHRSNVLSYCEFIRKSIKNVMKQPDHKQKVLGNFQQMFNEIDVDLRPDVDIKCELHVRVSELEEALMGIADERKANFLKEILKVAHNGWVADEMASLINFFLNAVQLEADRCVDTCQVIMDYYLSLQQKVPDEKSIEKIVVSKLQVKDRKYPLLSSSPQRSFSSLAPKNSDLRRNSRSATDQTNRSNYERLSKTRSGTDKRRKSSDLSFLTKGYDVITEILINLALPSDGVTPFHTFFKESIQGAANEIKSMMESRVSDVKKSERAVTRNQKKETAKSTSKGNLNIEWETALNDELSRFLFRMKLILARGIFDMNEFLAMILNTLSGLTEDINDMYMKEVQSISECCKVFRCGIEEEIPIRPQLELKGDEFYVNEDILLLPEFEESVDRVVNKEQKIRFSIEQLCLIFEKLRHVAPQGEIVKRSLLFILEDLRAFNPEMKNCNCFPEAWKFLDPEDMINLLDEFYQDLEIVDWRDFIVYALEIPMPSEEEILSMRKIFRKLDPGGTEIINRENYDESYFWFESTAISDLETEKNDKIKDLLFKMYQVDDYRTNYSAILLAFCKDENPIFGFTKALALAVGKKIITNEFAGKQNFFAQGEGDRFGVDDVLENYNADVHKKSYAATSETSIASTKCIPKERIKCTCTNDQEIVVDTHEEGDSSYDNTWSNEAGEAALLPFYDYNQSYREVATSTVPYKTFSSLLKTSFPSLAQLSVLLECKQTFQDTLNSMYDNLESHDDQVEVYSLLRQKFVYRLIQCTNKFRFINIRQSLLKKLKLKNLPVPSFCSLENLNCNLCLD